MAYPELHSVMRSMTYTSFHIALHALPAGARDKHLLLNGQHFEQLDLSPFELTEPLELSFEEAIDRLSALPRMFVEPDGSFVWVSESGQIDGMLFDRAGRLHYIELRGSCAEKTFERLTSIFQPIAAQAIQLIQQGLFMRADEFRRLVWGTEKEPLMNTQEKKKS